MALNPGGCVSTTIRETKWWIENEAGAGLKQLIGSQIDVAKVMSRTRYTRGTGSASTQCLLLPFFACVRS